MTPELALQNLGLYSSQVAILTAMAAALAWAFRLRVPRAELTFWYMLLTLCLLFPLLQPWHASPVQTAAEVTFGTILLRTAASTSHGFTLSWPYGWSGAALAALAAGAVLRLALLGLGVFRLRRLERRAAAAPACAALERAAALAGVQAEFRSSDEVRGPVTFGLRRPVVLLPAGFYDLAPAEQESVTVHELLHVRRSDWLYTIAEEIVRAVLWFHPAIWFVLNRIQLAREQAVDRAVVECTRHTDEYVGALLKIAAARIEPDLAPAPLFLKKRHLRERVAAIVKGANMSKRRLNLTMFAVLAALPLMAAFLAWQIPLRAAPQEVRDGQGVEVRTDVFKVLHRTGVEYPEEARQKGVSGGVVVAVTVNDKGDVTDAKIINGPDELRRAVLSSVLNWHFAMDPVTVNGEERPVPHSFEVAIMFNAPGTMTVIQQPGTRHKAMTIDRIDLSALPQTLRDRVDAAMPVRTGQLLTDESLDETTKALRAIDSHLRVRGAIKNNETATDLYVTLAGNTGPAERIRVGGNVQAMNLLQKVTPKYPPDAKAARVQGVVRMQATIGKDGHILDLQVLNGDPLLVPSALEAVRQWVYKPTWLNGEPVEVITQIDVNYTLAP